MGFNVHTTPTGLYRDNPMVSLFYSFQVDACAAQGSLLWEKAPLSPCYIRPDLGSNSRLRTRGDQLARAQHSRPLGCHNSSTLKQNAFKFEIALHKSNEDALPPPTLGRCLHPRPTGPARLNTMVNPALQYVIPEVNVQLVKIKMY